MCHKWLGATVPESQESDQIGEKCGNMAILWLSLRHNGSLLAQQLFHMNIYWYSWFGAIFTTFGYLFVSFVLFQSFIDVMKGATSVQFSLFSIIHPTQTQFWRRKKIAFLFNFHFFIPPHPNQIKFWNNFAFMFYSHFSNHSSHPIPPKKSINYSELVFGTEVLICQKNLRVVGRGLGWQTVGLIPPMFISWMTIPPRSHQVKY